MSQVSNQVAHQLRTMGNEVTLIATDRFDHASGTKGVVIRIVELIRIWGAQLRRSSGSKKTYSTISASRIGLIKNAIVLAPSLFLKRQLVLHSHSGGFDEFYSSLGMPGRALARWIVGRASLILVVHPRYQNHFNFAKCKVCSLVNASEDYGRPEGPHKQREPLRLLFLSNLIRRKGVEEVIDAARILSEAGTSVHVVIAGEIYDTDIGAQLATTNDNRFLDIQYLGPVRNRETITALFAAAHLMVFPTEYKNEALPLVVLEALSAGLPVVCTPFRALADIIVPGHNGWHCSRSADSIVTVLETFQALSDEERRVIKRNCRDDWSRQFTMNRFLLDLQRELASLP